MCFKGFFWKFDNRAAIYHIWKKYDCTIFPVLEHCVSRFCWITSKRAQWNKILYIFCIKNRSLEKHQINLSFSLIACIIPQKIMYLLKLYTKKLICVLILTHFSFVTKKYKSTFLAKFLVISKYSKLIHRIF